MKPANVLFILSDEHQRAAAGCYGHPLVQTPHLDRLAARGVRFTSAYTPCPICVPARASLATGRYVHQTGNWDNATPYDGGMPSWGHLLRQQGFQVASIGKLHFRKEGEDHGFTEEIDPLHVVDGIGDVLGCIRDDPPVRHKLDGVAEAGPGESTYLEYDARIAAQAADWIRQHSDDERPWVLFVSFVCPHPPYIAPQRLFDLYPPDQVPLPPQWRPEERPTHPALRQMREWFDLEALDEPTIRRAIAAYLGACTYLDERIGEVLGAVDRSGCMEKTRVIYSSDHGEDLGARGLFGKFTMYEESAGVPLLIAGPELPAGKVVDAPASLVDLFPTILDFAGAEPAPEDWQLPGQSLRQLMEQPKQLHHRAVLSEYHAVNSRRGIFMLRQGQYKLVHYVDGSPQLFDLAADPHELHDVATHPDHRETLDLLYGSLHSICDPESVDRQARAHQSALIEAHGGEAAVRRHGTFDNSPIPGETAAFRDQQ